MWRLRGERSEITDVGKVRQPIYKLLQQLHGHAHINSTSSLYGQRLQTRVLRIDPNTLMMLQLSRTYHSSLANALSIAACRHISHAPLISPQTVFTASLLLFFSLIYFDTFQSVFLSFLFATSRYCNLAVCFYFSSLRGKNLDSLILRLWSFNHSFSVQVEIQCYLYLQQCS